MESWKIAVCDPRQNDGAQFFLLNRSKTPVKVHRRLHFDPQTLFRRLRDVRFPFKYTEGLEFINFTIIPSKSDAVGYYLDNRIWIDVSQEGIDRVFSTFTHEIGHHVEENERVSQFLHEERLKKAKYLESTFSRRSDDEYLATGFEKFYHEDFEIRRQLKRMNPLLYRTIQTLHKSYKRK